jgi:hypothetical protein
MLEPYDLRKKIEAIFLSLLIIIALSYGVFRVYPLLMGPTITIISPHDGDYVSKGTFEVSGIAKRAKELTLQGRTIPIDEQGVFREILVSETPYTILIIRARDFYGKTVTKMLRVTPK